MKVKELIEALLKEDQDKEVYFDCYSEGIIAPCSSVSRQRHHILNKNVVTIME